MLRMTLKDWMQKEGLTQPEAAKRLGASQQDVSRWVLGKNEPTLRMALSIEKKTRGAVTAADLVVRP
jgi:transcriptional regulator with XRE-family HTH domain